MEIVRQSAGCHRKVRISGYFFRLKLIKCGYCKRTDIGYKKDKFPADHAVSGDRRHPLKQIDTGVGERMQTVLGAY